MARISSGVSIRWPLKVCFMTRNRWKSLGVRLGEYGGCSNTSNLVGCLVCWTSCSSTRPYRNYVCQRDTIWRPIHALPYTLHNSWWTLVVVLFFTVKQRIMERKSHLDALSSGNSILKCRNTQNTSNPIILFGKLLENVRMRGKHFVVVVFHGRERASLNLLFKRPS